jgi:hypothetical protein
LRHACPAFEIVNFQYRLKPGEIIAWWTEK